MISEPEILETAAIEAAVIPITCRREDMPKVIGPDKTSDPAEYRTELYRPLRR